MKEKAKYFGRYSHSTGFFTTPSGKRYKCTWEEYLEWVGKHRGLEVARRIQRHYELRTQNKKKNIKFDKNTIAKLNES